MSSNIESALMIRMEATLRNFEKQLEKGRLTANREANAIEGRLGKMNTRISASGEKAAMSMTRLFSVSKQGRFVLQNTSMQIADMAVQLEGGTNAMRVMGQQIPQVLGGFGALAGSVGILAPILGTLAAVGFPVAAMFLAGAEKAETLKDQIKDLNDSLAAYEGAVAAAGISSDDLVAKYGSLAESVREILQLQKQLAEESSGRSLTSLAGGAAEWGKFYDSPGGFRESQGITSFFDVNQIFTFTQAQRDLRQEADALGEEFLSIQGAVQAAGDDVEAQLVPMQQLLSIATQLADLNGERTEEENKFLGHLASVVEKQAQHVALKEQDRRTAQGILDDLQSEIALREAVAEYGAKSVEVAELRSAAERETLKAQLEVLQVSEELKDEILAAFDAAEQLSLVDVASGISDGVKEARALAEWMGVSLATAQKIAALGPQGAPGSSPVPGRGDPRNMGGSFFDWQNKDGTDFLSNWKPPTSKRRSRGGGGGVKEIEKFNRQYEALRAQLDPVWKATQRYEYAVRVLSKALVQGKIDQGEYNQLISKADEVYKKAASGSKGFESQIKGLAADLADVALGFEDLGDVAQRILSDIARNLMVSGINGLLSGSSWGKTLLGGGGLFGALIGGIPAYASGTMNHPGGLARINERGGEIVNLPSGAQVIPHDLSKRMAEQGGGSVTVYVEAVPGAEFEPRVQAVSQGVAVQVVQQNNRAISEAQRRR